MTREELEEGRRLLAESESMLERSMLRDWLWKHHVELLSLAEEARRRDVETELPESDAVVQVWHVSLHASESPIAYSVNVARSYGGGRWSLNMVTHWRPLPKGPAR